MPDEHLLFALRLTSSECFGVGASKGELLAPVPVTVAGLPGLRYGFEELDGHRVVEKNVIYGVRMNDTMGLFNFTAIAEGACLTNEGELTDPAILDRLLPGLDQAMAVVEPG